MKNTALFLKELFSGNIIDRAWFKEQRGLLLLIFGLLTLYVFVGYQAQAQRKHLSDLQKELQLARYEQITLSANLTDLTRQSAIARTLRERGSQLKENTKPVYSLE